MLNFVVLQHRLLISYIPFFSHYISRLSTFIALFAVAYILLEMVIGFFELRKGEVMRRPMLNPYHLGNTGSENKAEQRTTVVHRRLHRRCEGPDRREPGDPPKMEEKVGAHAINVTQCTIFGD